MKLEYELLLIVYFVSTVNSWKEVIKEECYTCTDCLCCWYCKDGGCKKFKVSVCMMSTNTTNWPYCYKEMIGADGGITAQIYYGCAENVALPVNRKEGAGITVLQNKIAPEGMVMKRSVNQYCSQGHFCNEFLSMSAKKATVPLLLLCSVVPLATAYAMLL